MFRVGVTFYLVVAITAGPWFCCCASDRIAGRISILTGRLTRANTTCDCAWRTGKHSRHDGHRGCPNRPLESPYAACSCQMDAPAKNGPSHGDWTDSERFARSLSETPCWGSHALLTAPYLPVRPFVDLSGEPSTASAFARLDARSILSIIQLFRC